MKYSEDKLKSVAENLRSMPSVKSAPTNTKADAVQFLIREIEEMQKRGYGFDEIAAALRENDIDISVATLRTYVYRARVKGATPKKTAAKVAKARKVKTKSPPVEQAVERTVDRSVDRSRAHFTASEDIPVDDL